MEVACAIRRGEERVSYGNQSEFCPARKRHAGGEETRHWLRFYVFVGSLRNQPGANSLRFPAGDASIGIEADFFAAGSKSARAQAILAPSDLRGHPPRANDASQEALRRGQDARVSG